VRYLHDLRLPPRRRDAQQQRIHAENLERLPPAEGLGIPERTQSFRLRRMTIHHVALEALRDQADSEVRFWALLGFEEVEPPATLRDRARWMESGHTQVHIIYADEAVTPPVGHVAVVAEDYGGTVERLRAAGVEVEAREAHWGARRCFVRSPTGHRVELMAAPPGE
jgi:catechol 2,3-dioxygenase-like lactoylglutathione lyase family enzyme